METISLDGEEKPFRQHEEHGTSGDEVTVSFQGSSEGQSLEIEMEHDDGQRFTIMSWFCCCRSRRRDNGTTFEKVGLGKAHRGLQHSREKNRKKEEVSGDGDGESILKVSNGLKSGFS